MSKRCGGRAYAAGRESLGRVNVVKHWRDVDAGLFEARAVLFEFGLVAVERNVMNGADGGGHLRLACVQFGIDRGDARRGLGRLGEPKEGEALILTNVKEKVLTAIGAREFDRLDKAEAHDIAIKAERALHVGTDNRRVVHPSKLHAIGTRMPVLAAHVSEARSLIARRIRRLGTACHRRRREMAGNSAQAASSGRRHDPG